MGEFLEYDQLQMIQNNCSIENVPISLFHILTNGCQLLKLCTAKEHVIWHIKILRLKLEMKGSWWEHNWMAFLSHSLYYINSCTTCQFREHGKEEEVHRYWWYLKHHTMPLAKVELFLDRLMAQHAVCLKPIHRYSKVTWYLREVLIYACQRGQKFPKKTNGDDDNGDRWRQCSTAKYVGCKFSVHILYPDEEGRYVEVHINEEHSSHEQIVISYMFIKVQFITVLRC